MHRALELKRAARTWSIAPPCFALLLPVSHCSSLFRIAPPCFALLLPVSHCSSLFQQLAPCSRSLLGPGGLCRAGITTCWCCAGQRRQGWREGCEGVPVPSSPRSKMCSAMRRSRAPGPRRARGGRALSRPWQVARSSTRGTAHARHVTLRYGKRCAPYPAQTVPRKPKRSLCRVRRTGLGGRGQAWGKRTGLGGRGQARAVTGYAPLHCWAYHQGGFHGSRGTHPRELLLANGAWPFVWAPDKWLGPIRQKPRLMWPGSEITPNVIPFRGYLAARPQKIARGMSARMVENHASLSSRRMEPRDIDRGR